MVKYLLIGTGSLVVLWAAALLVNFPIYQETTVQGTIIHPIVDGILFFGLIFGFIWLLASVIKDRKRINLILSGTGVVTLVLIFVFFAMR
ncbi:hypothetical protein CR205_01870 [Alteribacter lacisalsi]|uniref:Uncharacterized protein n=1 Tax=Alteribacter lacisalsi TaxID=2045244 RepID=A0A2W0HIR8_9BACI|nr:hypothetical protein [Alteribacter lacisalsi]PYZ97375.1 hypothetical protein CR205_01870 [Alteribacter lacisalsi]